MIKNIFLMVGLTIFYFSDYYLLLITDVGHVRFVKYFSGVLVWTFRITKFIQYWFPFAYNTINLIVPTYFMKVFLNLLENPLTTLKRYRTLGLHRDNLYTLTYILAYGIVLDIGLLPGSSVLRIATKLSTKSIELFIEKARNCSEKELMRLYGNVSTVGGVYTIRNYITHVFGDFIRFFMVMYVSMLISVIHKIILLVYPDYQRPRIPLEPH